MRDHHRLEAFWLADQLILQIYRATRSFPVDERFGLVTQIRRSAVSVGANIVEGSARISKADYVRFLNIAYSSACELEYELSLCIRLGYLGGESTGELENLASRTCKALRGLVIALAATPE